MVRLIYSFLYFTFFIPIFAFTTRKRNYSVDFKERFVSYKTDLKGVYWFHCASVGELKLVEPIIRHYKKKGRKILITIFSPRGLEFAKKNFPDLEIRPVPFDLKFLIDRFVSMYKPKVLFLVEEEFWFNLTTAVSKKHIPIISLNSRLSEKSVKNYKRFSFFYKPIFRSISKYLVRSVFDFSLLKEFVDEKRLVLCGDLKFLSSTPTKEIDLVVKRDPIIVLGSTHHPEEKVFLNIFNKLKEHFPNIAFVIAPRHLERVPQIEKLINEMNLSYTKRTESKVLDKDIYILDTLGELNGVYKFANLVFVGGTIANIGGHNVLEPACLGKIILVGKNIHKIKSNAYLLNRLGVLHFIENINELDKQILELLNKNISEKEISSKLSDLSRKIAECYLRELKD